MYRLLVSVLMSVYTFGFMFFPAGMVVNLPETYKHCQTEDPDMDLTDFVFEHLLNLPEIGYFDTDGIEENEKPHQPLQHLVLATQVVLSITNPVRLQYTPASPPESVTRTYPLFNDARLQSQYLSQVFHPPIV
jgi:hypothetical protein